MTRGGTVFADRQLESMLPPTVVSSVPVRGDTLFSANQNVVLQFSKVIDTASVRRAFSITPAAAGRLLWAQNNTRLDFDPDAVLPFFVDYTVRVDTVARSLGGQMLDGDGNGVPGDPYILTFRTRDVDAFAPVIVSSWPSPGAVLPAPATVLNVSFDERLNPATVTQTNVSVQRIGGSVLSREVQYWETGSRGAINIILQNPLEPGAQYRIRVSGVTDLVGNPIPNTTMATALIAISYNVYYSFLSNLKYKQKGRVMKQVNLGSQGLCVPAIGLGCMGMSEFYGSSSESQNLGVLDRAADIGCTFWDTSDMYGPFTNEILLSKALKGRRDQITLATKFGVSRGEDGS